MTNGGERRTLQYPHRSSWEVTRQVDAPVTTKDSVHITMNPSTLSAKCCANWTQQLGLYGIVSFPTELLDSRCLIQYAHFASLIVTCRLNMGKHMSSVRFATRLPPLVLHVLFLALQLLKGFSKPWCHLGRDPERVLLWNSSRLGLLPVTGCLMAAEQNFLSRELGRSPYTLWKSIRGLRETAWIVSIAWSDCGKGPGKFLHLKITQ